jgi:hypothetical protein
MLPRYVLDNILAHEVAYQMVEEGITTALQTMNKRSWPNFPINLGKFTLTNIPHTRKEVTSLKELILCIGTMKKHKPRNFIYNHYKTLKMVPPFEN